MGVVPVLLLLNNVHPLIELSLCPPQTDHKLVAECVGESEQVGFGSSCVYLPPQPKSDSTVAAGAGAVAVGAGAVAAAIVTALEPSSSSSSAASLPPYPRWMFKESYFIAGAPPQRSAGFRPPDGRDPDDVPDAEWPRDATLMLYKIDALARYLLPEENEVRACPALAGLKTFLVSFGPAPIGYLHSASAWPVLSLSRDTLIAVLLPGFFSVEVHDRCHDKALNAVPLCCPLVLSIRARRPRACWSGCWRTSTRPRSVSGSTSSTASRTPMRPSRHRVRCAGRAPAGENPRPRRRMPRPAAAHCASTSRLAAVR